MESLRDTKIRSKKLSGRLTVKEKEVDKKVGEL